MVFIFSPIDKHHFLHFRHHPTRSCSISQKCMVKPRARSYTKLELNEIPREESNSWKWDHFIVSASQFFCSSAVAILPNRCLASGLTIRMRKLGLPATQPGVVGVPSTPPIAKLDQLDLAACTYCKNLWCDSRCCTLKCQTFWWLLWFTGNEDNWNSVLPQQQVEHKHWLRLRREKGALGSRSPCPVLLPLSLFLLICTIQQKHFFLYLLHPPGG